MGTTSFSSTDWYDTPRYYDIVFDEDTAKEADFLEAMRERHGRSRGRAVLEPACGSGRLVAELAERGQRVTGFDLSEEMLAYARQRLKSRGLQARLVSGRMEDFRFRERFDLAHCFVSTFKYLLDERSARSHLECVARSLKKGGIYVLGVHLTEYGYDRRVRERWVAERGGTKVVCNIQSWPPDSRRRLEKVRSRLIVQEDGEEKRLETSWMFRTYDAAQLRRLLRSVGDLEHVTTYDFTYELGSERELDDEQMDCVLVLRRR